MDFQCSSCFLLIKSLITILATFAAMPIAGSGPVSGSEELHLADSSAISFPSIPMCPGTDVSFT